MIIAITGSNGFIASHLINEIKNIEGGYKLKLIDIMPNTLNYQYEYFKTNYSIDELKKILKNVDAVIHLAARRGKEDNLNYFYDNIRITENIYFACASLNIKNIVFSSSISVYSDQNNLPWREYQAIQPVSFYGISKAVCEFMSELYNKKHNLNIKSLRIAPVYGIRNDGNFMIDIFIRKAIKKEKLIVIGKSIARREYIYVKDVVNAILISLKKSEQKGIFNIGSGEALTNLEVANYICDVFANKYDVEYLENEDEQIESSYMDSSKAKELLGFYPRFSFKDGLLDIKRCLSI